MKARQYFKQKTHKVVDGGIILNMFFKVMKGLQIHNGKEEEGEENKEEREKFEIEFKEFFLCLREWAPSSEILIGDKLTVAKLASQQLAVEKMGKLMIIRDGNRRFVHAIDEPLCILAMLDAAVNEVGDTEIFFQIRSGARYATSTTEMKEKIESMFKKTIKLFDEVNDYEITREIVRRRPVF